MLFCTIVRPAAGTKCHTFPPKVGATETTFMGSVGSNGYSGDPNRACA